jgi:hypothetical protein
LTQVAPIDCGLAVTVSETRVDDPIIGHRGDGHSLLREPEKTACLGSLTASG